MKLLYHARQAKLANLLQISEVGALALNPGPSLFYLTGLQFHLMERPVLALFTPHNPPILVLPELEEGKAAHLPFLARIFTFSDNPQTWAGAYRQAGQEAHIAGQRVGVEADKLRVLELWLLEEAVPASQIVSSANLTSQLRIQKDESELNAMRKAVKIAEKALEDTLPSIKIGRTEREIASELTQQLLRAGSQAEFPFSPIVSSGPNSANPHAAPTDRLLEAGDLIVVDWGARYNDYISDITRTIAISPIDSEFELMASVVAEANATGRAAARPGIAAGDVDRAARQVIETAGYGSYFTHRIGHGIGLEGHEEPYLYGENQLNLSPGMTFTVEPGIYLSGKGGVRIEDNLAITTDGAECLTSLPRDLIKIKKT